MDKIENIDISLIDNFNNHPFHIVKNEEYNELLESIQLNGILNAVIVRPKKNGRYEMISGHRRLEVCKDLQIKTIPTIVKTLTDEEAIIIMVDSNIQREKILPSEKAFAYKMKLEAIKHQGKKLTSTPRMHKCSLEEVGYKAGDSREKVRRYIRLTHLIPELLNIVDYTATTSSPEGITMGIKPAVEISYLNKEEQQQLYSIMTYYDLSPSHAQTIRIRKLSEENKLTSNNLEDILMEEKGNQHEQISFNKEKIVSVLPNELINRDKRYIESYVIEALINYANVKERGDSNDLEL